MTSDQKSPYWEKFNKNIFHTVSLHWFQFISDKQSVFFLEKRTMRHLYGSKEILSDGKNEHTMPLSRRMWTQQLSDTCAIFALIEVLKYKVPTALSCLAIKSQKSSRKMFFLLLALAIFSSSVSGHGGVLWPPVWQDGVGRWYHRLASTSICYAVGQQTAY